MRLTVAQALVRFLTVQHSERDGERQRFFAGCFGIFGHGNLAGIGQALLQAGDELRYYQARNEQAMVHAAVGYARARNRLQALACTTSIGPGATNMVTGAATATVNRIPVLLLPGDVFASRATNPVLQELEDPRSMDVSVNDCFRPVSRYFDRIFSRLCAAWFRAWGEKSGWKAILVRAVDFHSLFPSNPPPTPLAKERTGERNREDSAGG